MSERVCPKCSHKGAPSLELTTKGLVPMCAPCGWQFQDEAPEIVLTHNTPQAAPRPTTTGYVRVNHPPLDPIQIVQDRLTFLMSEEARLEGVKADTAARLAGVRAESKRLQKMLHAAGPNT